MGSSYRVVSLLFCVAPSLPPPGQYSAVAASSLSHLDCQIRGSTQILAQNWRVLLYQLNQVPGLLAGIEEPFTIHGTASCNAPAQEFNLIVFQGMIFSHAQHLRAWTSSRTVQPWFSASWIYIWRITTFVSGGAIRNRTEELYLSMPML